MTGQARALSVNEFMIVLEGAVTIVDARDRAVTIKAGESFLIPKGLPCVWRQDGYMRKFFVIFDDASGNAAGPGGAGGAAPRSAGRAERPATARRRSCWRAPAPTQHDKQYFADLTAQWTVGVWDSTAYHRKTISFPRHELMHILEGEVTLTEEGGPAADLQGRRHLLRADGHALRLEDDGLCAEDLLHHAAEGAAATGKRRRSRGKPQMHTDEHRYAEFIATNPVR